MGFHLAASFKFSKIYLLKLLFLPLDCFNSVGSTCNPEALKDFLLGDFSSKA